ncbi:MAG: ethanolamine utilization protein EutN [Firmicutes bacterium]|nr:ethanolamine utilization protein EutN [Bacillota bacterium]
MQLMKVIGNLVSTRKNERLVGSKFLILKSCDNKTNENKGGSIVAVDLVGAGIGEEVLVVTGSSARLALEKEDSPVDAAIVGIVDNLEIKE